MHSSRFSGSRAIFVTVISRFRSRTRLFCSRSRFLLTCICMCSVASAACDPRSSGGDTGTGHMLPNGQPFLLRARGSLTGNLAEGRRKRSGANGKPPFAFPCGHQLDSSSSQPEFPGRDRPCHHLRFSCIQIG